MIGFWQGLFSWFVDDCFLSLSSHGRGEREREGEREKSSLFSSKMGTNPIHEGPTPMTYLFPKDLTSKYYHTRDRGFNI